MAAVFFCFSRSSWRAAQILDRFSLTSSEHQPRRDTRVSWFSRRWYPEIRLISRFGFLRRPQNQIYFRAFGFVFIRRDRALEARTFGRLGHLGGSDIWEVRPSLLRATVWQIGPARFSLLQSNVRLLTFLFPTHRRQAKQRRDRPKGAGRNPSGPHLRHRNRPPRRQPKPNQKVDDQHAEEQPLAPASRIKSQCRQQNDPDRISRRRPGIMRPIKVAARHMPE
jgi:hypothetical protein